MIWEKCIKMDSIREGRTKEEVIEEIRALFNCDMDGSLSIVLVEGSDDVEFMEIVLEDNVVIIEAPSGGKHGLDDLMRMENLEIQRKDVIAVRDKDYIDVQILADRFFVYDGCCLETMILLNPKVAEGLSRMLIPGIFDRRDYVIKVMKQIAPYSILRKNNELENRRISFKNVGFGNLIIEGRLDIRGLFERVRQMDAYEVCKEEADSIMDDFKLWDITNGHDLCTYLAQISRQGTKTPSENDIRKMLFMIYRKEDFLTTQLYTKLLEYQRENNVRFVSE